MDRSAKKLGLFGGTFDPIHNAHIEIALLAKSKFNLDEVHFIVAKDPPIKEHVILDAERRFQLVVKALAAYEGLLASRIELDRAGKSYSYLTVQYYKEAFSDLELFWIMGEDAFASLKEWKNFDYLKENLSFLVFSRVIDKSELAEMNGLRVFKIDDIPLDLSSTKIKEHVKNNLSLAGLVPTAIEQLIVEYYR